MAESNGGAAFILSGFGDEISADLDEQLDVLRSLGVGYLELRGAWGKNVLDFGEAELKRIRRALADRGMAVSSIGSPIGKIGIEEPFAPHFDDFRRIMDTAAYLACGFVRIFSFYVAADEHEQRRSEVMERLQSLVEAAEPTSLTLLHENEKDIYGDTPERCADILTAIDSPKLRAVFDPANYVQVGVVRPFDRGWPLLGRYVEYVHVKDAVLATGAVVPAGHGDGQVPEVIAALHRRGGRYFLSIEPHLVLAGRSAGFTGADLFREAVDALRELLPAGQHAPSNGEAKRD